MSYQQEVFHFISSIIGQNNNIVIPVEIIKFTGDYHTAALLSQLIYWQGKQRDPEDWIYKTYDQWEIELMLSKYQTSRAAKALVKIGILETKVARVRLDNGMLGDRAVHYRLKHDEFVKKFTEHLSIMESKETSLSKVKELHFPKSSNLTNLPIYTETTSRKYDNVPAPPPPDPKPIPRKNTSEPSSSFSEDDLNTLIQAVPDERKSPEVEKRLQKALIVGFTVAYLLDAITYSHDQSNGNFLGYLGNAIDKEYAPEGYHRTAEETRRKQQENEARQREKQKEVDKELSALEKHNRQVNDLLERVDTQSLDQFIGTQDLSQVERRRYQQGKMPMLRRKYVVSFWEQKT